MKLQAYDLPLGKPQTRRRTPKIAPLLILTFLLTIIPIYYPSLRYSLKKLSSATFDSIEDSLATTTSLEDRSEPCPLEGGDSRLCESISETQPVSASSSSSDGLVAGKEEEEEGNAENLPENPQEEESLGTIKLSENEETSFLPGSTGEKSETGINNTPSGGETDGRKKPGRKGRKRPGHRKKDSAGHVDTRGNNKVHSSSVLMMDNANSCDLFTGEWVWNPEGPYYTNETCWAIQEHQNCMKFGRPDTEYLKWRWKPDGCELPVFDPRRFLELVRGKSLAFVGDSVARNHMQSLICLLSRVVYPVDVSKSINDQNRRYEYRDYNFNISIFWAPYLTRAELTDPENVTLPFKLYLDEFDENWTTKIADYDYIVISAGQWFMRPTYFYEKRKLVGCLYCPPSDKVTYLTSYFSYRRAFRTAFKAINSLDNFKGVTFLRTFAPSHFEGGAWDKGGKCVRTRPFKRNETSLADYAEKMYNIQLQELQIAQREGRRKGVRFRLFDSTKSMLLRPDGHPSRYGHWPEQRVSLPEDCVHWCLPGPIDAWNDFLLELLKREQELTSQTVF